MDQEESQKDIIDSLIYVIVLGREQKGTVVNYGKGEGVFTSSR